MRFSFRKRSLGVRGGAAEAHVGQVPFAQRAIERREARFRLFRRDARLQARVHLQPAQPALRNLGLGGISTPSIVTGTKNCDESARFIPSKPGSSTPMIVIG